MDFARPLRTLARRWPLAAGLAAAMTALGFLSASCGTTTYTARARLFLRDSPPSPDEIPPPLQAAWSRSASPSFLISDAVLERAVREGLQDHFPADSPEALASAVLAVRSSLTARSEEGPNLIVLSSTDGRPGRAVAIVNAVARAFDAVAAGERLREAEEAAAFLEKRTQDLRQRRDQLSQAAREIGPPAIEPEFERVEKALAEEISVLERSLTAARLESASLAVGIDLLMDRLERGELGPAPPADTAESDRLGRELEAARTALDELRAARPEDVTGIAAASDRVDRLRRLRAEAMDRELLHSRFAPVRSLLDELREKNGRRDRLATSARDLQVQIDKARQRLAEHTKTPPKEALAEARERRERHQGLVLELERIGDSIRDLEALRARIIAAAPLSGPPTGRLEPAAAAASTVTRAYGNLPLWLLLGLVLGTGAALAPIRAEGVLHTEADVRRCVNLPILGIVPRTEEEEEPVLVRAAPATALSENWQSIATVLERLARDADAGTFLVTSPEAGEGKSSAACNLAVALARSGARTLLVDADLRRPTQHQIFALPSEWSEAGLSAFLQQTIETVDPAIAATEIENLSLLPAGPFPGALAPFLRSERFGAMLEGLQERYEYVVMDAPPVRGAADTLLLAPRAHAVVMVLAAGESRKDHVTEAKRLLAAAGGKLVGCVLNKASAPGRGYYSYSPYSYVEVES